MDIHVCSVFLLARHALYGASFLVWSAVCYSTMGSLVGWSKLELDARSGVTCCMLPVFPMRLSAGGGRSRHGSDSGLISANAHKWAVWIIVVPVSHTREKVLVCDTRVGLVS